MLGDEADAGAELEARGCAGGRAERDERVVDAAVLLGQRAVGRERERGVAVDRHVDMLGDEEALEAAVLDGAGELDHVHGLVGREDEDAMLHALLLTCGGRG